MDLPLDGLMDTLRVGGKDFGFFRFDEMTIRPVSRRSCWDFAKIGHCLVSHMTNYALADHSPVKVVRFFAGVTDVLFLLGLDGDGWFSSGIESSWGVRGEMDNEEEVEIGEKERSGVDVISSP